MDGTNRKNIKIGTPVSIVQKHHQPTGELTDGYVADILTSASIHPRGIKVRLHSGEVGRVQIIHNLEETKILKLDGANMDIDLATDSAKISWKQDACPWNRTENTNIHKCAIKNISICQYFCGIEYLDNVLCCYPNKNPCQDNKK